jgi:multidrug efflux pump subunit AcrA (membrane-fusion protein)
MGIWTDGRTKANWVIYRLTDIMLLKAEALAGLMVDDADDKDGSLKTQNKPYYDQAFNLINAVNKRSVCRKTYPADFLKEDTLDMEDNRSREKLYELVLEERQRELLFEGKRWFDLVRMARREGSSATLAKYASKKQQGGGTMAANRLQKMDAIYWPYNINELKVKVSIPEAEMHSINANTQSTITVDAVGEVMKGGTIEKGVQADALTHTYDIRIKVANPKHKLLPGMVTSVKFINDGSQAISGISVPVTAVQKGVDKSHFVWIIDKDSTAHRNKVSTGTTTGNYIGITDGIKVGQRIVTQGYQKLSEGTKVIF